MMKTLLLDGLRSLTRDARFTVVAAALLAVTIGAVTAVYAIVHAVVLRPFPFADQDRIVVLWQRDDRRALPIIEVAHGEAVEWRTRSRSFEDLAVIGSVNWDLSLVREGRTESVPLSAVSHSFFRVAGAMPALGRAFEEKDEDGALPRTMVISHGLWLRRFGGDPTIVGRSVPVRLDAERPPVGIEIVGVMPRDFDFPRGAEVWVPAAPLIRKYSAAAGDADGALRGLRVFYGLARLKAGVSLEAAARDATQIMRTPVVRRGAIPNEEVVLVPIARYLLGAASPVLWTLLGGAVLMLGIACANVAGLQVSRSSRRQRDLAVRAAIGASRRRLIGSALMESAILTLTALVCGIGVAVIVMRGLVVLAPTAVPRLDEVALLEPAVLGIAALATFVTVLLCGVWPAMIAGRIDALAVLAHGGSVAADPRGRRVQRAVVIVQVAVALTLLAGTALFLRTLRGLDRTVLGFDPERLLAMQVRPSTEDLTRWNAFYDGLIRRVETLPDVTAAAGVGLRPLSGPIGWDSQPLLHGQIVKDPSTWALNPHTNVEVVTPGYFRALGTRLIRGRFFTDRDDAAAPGVVIVSETAARRLWPGREALGQQMRDPTYKRGGSESDVVWQTVVGVVEDVRYRGLNDVRLDLYLPPTQSTNRVQQLMVRTRGNPSDAMASIQAAAREIDPNVEISEPAIMSDVVAAESAPWRFLMRVFVAFAVLAAGLATVGLGAVVALAVSLRRRELAIRAALGADRARLRALVLREGLALVALGIGLGLGGALALGRAVGHVLVGVAPHDPIALGLASVVAIVAGSLASAIPARRAAEADPLDALRAE